MAPLSIREERDRSGVLVAVTFNWKGLRVGHACDEMPAVEIECEGAPLLSPEGRAEDDDWLNFEVRREGYSRWSATWRPDSALPSCSVICG